MTTSKTGPLPERTAVRYKQYVIRQPTVRQVKLGVGPKKGKGSGQFAGPLTDAGIAGSS